MSLKKPKQEYRNVTVLPKYITIQIPTDWSFIHLKEIIVSQNSGFHNRLERSKEGDNIVGMIDLYENNRIEGQQFLLAKFPFDEKEKYKLNEGDLIYVEISLVRIGVGKTIYTTKDGSGTYFAGNVRRFSISEKCNPVFLYYLLNLEIFRNSMINRSYTTALTGITVKDYFKTKIPLPSLKEQQKIVSILSNVDDLIESCDKTLDSNKKLKKGLIQQLLTKGINHKKFKKIVFSPRHLSRIIPEDWKVVILENILLDKPQNGINVKLENYGKGVPIFEISSLYESEFTINQSNLRQVPVKDKDELKRYQLEENDFLVNRVSKVKEGVGKMLLVSNPIQNLIYEGNIIRIRINKKLLLPKFLEFLSKTSLYMNYIQSTCKTTSLTSIDQDIIQKIPIMIPSIKEQSKIIQTLENVDFRTLDLESEKIYFEQLKKGLMQTLLIGQIRV